MFKEIVTSSPKSMFFLAPSLVRLQPARTSSSASAYAHNPINLLVDIRSPMSCMGRPKPHPLKELETNFWAGLASNANAVYDFLAPQATMLPPGGRYIDAAAILPLRNLLESELRRAHLEANSISGWDSYCMSEVRSYNMGSDGGVICYRVKAVREKDGAELEAMCSSTWSCKESGEWKLLVHQRTPMSR